jgi:hypothetical protein
MRVVRVSSIEEYASWYLRREARKHNSDLTPGALQGQVEAMRQYHGGKVRDWFNASTCWYIVKLELVGELADLVFLECPWTKEEGLVIRDGPDYRLLDRVAANAIASRYLARPSARKHKDYYDQLATGSLKLAGEDRIAICSAEPGEIAANPAACYYLLDGVGRCLPYMILLKEQKLKHTPIEAFLAERRAV